MMDSDLILAARTRLSRVRLVANALDLLIAEHMVGLDTAPLLRLRKLAEAGVFAYPVRLHAITATRVCRGLASIAKAQLGAVQAAEKLGNALEYADGQVNIMAEYLPGPDKEQPS